jgi:hypothetical protein
MTSHNRKCLSEDYHQVGQHHNFLGQYHHILQLLLIRAMPLEYSLHRQLTIPRVCALNGEYRSKS